MKREASKKRPSGRKVGEAKKRQRLQPIHREKIVRMHLDDKIPLDLLSTETGVSKTSIRTWCLRYQESGLAGLEDRPHPGGASKLPDAVSEKIVELKKETPTFGIRRIGDVLGRWFGLPGSRETVRQVLKEEGLSTPPKKGRTHNPSKPRFFERATPNQMWQSDIMSFRLGGRQVYLIGFVDDYSRYMVGLGLFTTQTSSNVLDVYRKATSEYGVPKEMLTDNGRQYTSWRGTTKFESDLAKDKVRHIRSQPHHPQTLGKIERFWKTILEEYLSRAQFDSFENARERIAMWVKHYNHRRPHQGIGGMCPADRFFEVASEVRKVVERQIAENVLELALRGKPRAPFYLVGRMDGQSVVLQAEKGRLKLSVSGDGGQEMQEKEFTLGGNDGTEAGEAVAAVRGSTEGGGGAFDLDGTQEAPGGLPRAGDRLDYIEPVAGTRDGGDVAGPGTPREPGPVPGAEPSPGGDAGEASGVGPAGEAGEAHRGSNEEAEGDCVRAGREAAGVNDGHLGEGGEEDGGRAAGAERDAERDPGRGIPGRLAPELPRMGGTYPAGDGGGGGGPSRGPSGEAGGSGGGATAAGAVGSAAGHRDAEDGGGDQEGGGPREGGAGLGHVWSGR